MVWNNYGDWPPYVSVAERRNKTNIKIASLRKKGEKINPIQLEGHSIANTFWGKSWCQNLESYSDFKNRLPRGRSYLRNGSVLDLQITAGKVNARVSGSSVYDITIYIRPIKTEDWSKLVKQCSGKIDSAIELLKGNISKAVLQMVCDKKYGLFPKPKEISMECSCPDWAEMCKHVAATLYGVGSKLDHEPELLFLLRKVSHLDLIDEKGISDSLVNRSKIRKDKILKTENLSKIFGIEMDKTVSKTTRSTTNKNKPKLKKIFH